MTVVMPFLDAEQYIGAAIDSVFAQTLRHWELLLVDDGSRDRSRGIAERYAERDPARVRILQHPGGANRGIAASRNLAMRAARGRYIAFLDADDLYLPERLEHHVRQLEADPGLGIVVSAEWYWHSWQPVDARAGTSPDYVIRPAVEPGRRIAPPAFIASTLVTRGAPMPATCSVTFRKAAFDELGGAPDSFRGHYEDQALFCKLLLSLPMLALDEPLARYRQRSESVTQANAPLDRVSGSAARVARMDFLVWLQRYLVEQDRPLPEVDAWLEREISALRPGAGAPSLPRGAIQRQAARRAAAKVLPERVRHALVRSLRTIDARRVRRRVMRRIAAYESSNSSPDGAIRAYWNARIDDTVLSSAAHGTPEFFAALDAYRLRKNEYLPRVVDFGAWEGREVLEIGCGPGLDLVRFARGGAHVTGIDIAPAALELARGCCRIAGVEAALLEADGARLPFEEASFDLVYCHGVLSFVRDPAQVVVEAYRVLRPGGQAILMVYNRRSWMQWLLRLPGSPMGQGHADAPAFRTYSRPEFERMLAPFAERRLVFERFAPASWHRGPLRWLRPFGWHLLAFCRKAA